MYAYSMLFNNAYGGGRVLRHTLPSLCALSVCVSLWPSTEGLSWVQGISLRRPFRHSHPPKCLEMTYAQMFFSRGPPTRPPSCVLCSLWQCSAWAGRAWRRLEEQEFGGASRYEDPCCVKMYHKHRAAPNFVRNTLVLCALRQEASEDILSARSLPKWSIISYVQEERDDELKWSIVAQNLANALNSAMCSRRPRATSSASLPACSSPH